MGLIEELHRCGSNPPRGLGPGSKRRPVRESLGLRQIASNAASLKGQTAGQAQEIHTSSTKSKTVPRSRSTDASQQSEHAPAVSAGQAIGPAAMQRSRYRVSGAAIIGRLTRSRYARAGRVYDEHVEDGVRGFFDLA